MNQTVDSDHGLRAPQIPNNLGADPGRRLRHPGIVRDTIRNRKADADCAHGNPISRNVRAG